MENTIENKTDNVTALPLALFKSRTRQALLRLFFTNPDARYYVRELNTMLGISVGTLHREIKHLEELGVIQLEAQGNVKYYTANQDHPLFDEFTSIVAKTIGVEVGLKEVLAEIPGIKLAFTYGSFASGQETKKGDIYMFLAGKFDEKLVKEALKKLEKQLKRKIHHTSMSEEEFRRELKKHPPHLLDIFTEPKTFLIGEGNALQAFTG